MKKNEKKLYTHKIEMPNGIKILVQEDHSHPSIAMTAYFLGGKRFENLENAGITSLNQRLILKGAGEYNAQNLAEEMELHGIKMSPFHGVDTAGIKMKSLSRYFDKGLNIFSKIIQEPTFPQDEFEKEKNNLLEDIKTEKDSNLYYCKQMNEGLVFESHPYQVPLYGTLESVKKINRENIVNHHNLIYSPDRMVIAFVGDIKAKEAEEKITKYFSNFNKSEIPVIDPGDKKGPIKNVKEKIEHLEKQQVAICVGYHAPDINSEDYYTFRILNQVLSGMGSRLFIELRDKQGLAYTVNSLYKGYLNGGIFQAYILTGHTTKDKARMSLLEEVDRLRTRLVTYDELVRAKRYHLGLFDINLQSKSEVSSNIAYSEIIGLGYNFIDSYPERIKRITRQKVKRAAEKFLKPQSYAISILTPATCPKNLQ